MNINKKIGLSLNTSFLTQKNMNESDKIILEHYKTFDDLLNYLSKKGISHIELHDFNKYRGENIAEEVSKLWDKGFSISVHGALFKDITFEEYSPVLLKLIEKSKQYQNNFIVVVHAIAGTQMDCSIYKNETINILNSWCTQTENIIPVMFALEINRRKLTNDPATTCANVLSILNSVPKTNIGTCWDFGHYYYNMLVKDKTPCKTPSNEFLDRVVHTHIHSLDDNNKTHFPLCKPNKLPLELYVKELAKVNYSDVYNLELSFERWKPKDILSGLESSLNSLSDCING